MKCNMRFKDQVGLGERWGGEVQPGYVARKWEGGWSGHVPTEYLNAYNQPYSSVY